MQMESAEDWTRLTSERVEALIDEKREAACGYLIWTRRNHGEEGVRENIVALQKRKIAHLRTNISWCEWYEAGNRQWIAWYIREYARHFRVLPCLSFTPPALGIKPQVNAPPKDAAQFSIFVEEVLSELGTCFTEVELGNEWNIETDWDQSLDRDYVRLCEMIVRGAEVAHRYGKRTVLGGASKINDSTLLWLAIFRERGLFAHIDACGFHNLRGTWSDHVPPLALSMQAHLVQAVCGMRIGAWLTEYGFPVIDTENRFSSEWLEEVQVALFAYALYCVLSGAIERLYWYTYKDEVHESLRKATTGWEDVLQFYFGDTDQEEKPRLLGRLLMEGGPTAVLRYAVEKRLMPLVDEASLKRKLPS